MTKKYVTTVTFSFYTDEEPNAGHLAELVAAAEGAYETMHNGDYAIDFVESITYDNPEFHGPVQAT